MQEAAIDQLINKTGSIYKLVVLASRRALELSDNAGAKLVETEASAKPAEVALKEIIEGKISWKIKSV